MGYLFLLLLLYFLFEGVKKREHKSDEEIEREIELEREEFKQSRELEKDIDYFKMKFKNQLIKLGMIVLVYSSFLAYITIFPKEANLSKVLNYLAIEDQKRIIMFMDKLITFAVIITFLKLVFSSHKPNKVSKIPEIMICLTLFVFFRIAFHFL